MRINITFQIFLLIGSILSAGCQPVIDREDLTSAGLPEPERSQMPATPSWGVDLNSEVQDDHRPNTLLTFWHPFSGRQAELVAKLVEEYNRENNIGVNIFEASHADDEILIADFFESIDENSQPDIILAPSYFLKELYQGSFVSEIDESLYPTFSNQNGGGIFRLFSDIDAEEGKRYGVPYLQLGHFLFFNLTWTEELGFTKKPQTIADFNDLVCAGFNNMRFGEDLQNIGTGGYFFPLGEVPILSWLVAFDGSPLFNPRGDVVFETEQNVTAVSFLHQLYAEDCAWWSPNERYPYKYFANRNAIIYSGRVDEIAAQTEVNTEQGSLDQWMIIPYPSVSEKPIVFFENYSFALVNSEGDSLGKSAADFIQWMLEPDQHVEMIYLTGAYPLNTKEIQGVDKDWDHYAIWQDSVQYIPFSKPIPSTEKWSITKKVLGDLSWQIIQFTVSEADIPLYLRDAESLINTVKDKNP